MNIAKINVVMISKIKKLEGEIIMNKELWKKCVEFHGHECPGLAIGFRACEVAVEKMNLKFSSDEEIVCVT